ncbi:histone deacetylase 14 [Tanacetum coccineum]
MADENVPSPALTRSDDKIMPFNAWVPIGRSNYVLDLQKKQQNPIFLIFVDILQNTNFFRAFNASTSVPAIYVQQFWNTLTYDAKTGIYNFQLDEEWFVLDVDLLRAALEITPIDQNHLFESPLPDDAIMDYVTQLGYPGEIYFVSHMLIIYHLGRNHDIHKRPGSPISLASDDLILGNLKFIPKGERDEVFGMNIPEELITEEIQNSLYYMRYVEIMTRYERQLAAEGVEVEEPAPKSAKSKIPATIRQSKPASSMPTKPAPAKEATMEQEQPSKPALAKQPRKGKVIKVRKQKGVGHLVDKDYEEGEPTLEPRLHDEEADVQRAIELSLKDLEEHGRKGKGIAIDEKSAQSLLDLHTPKAKKASETETKIFDGSDDKGEEVPHTAGPNPGSRHEGLAGSNLDLHQEDQAGPNPGSRCVDQTGPDSKPIHKKFLTSAYSHMRINLKIVAEEQAHLENPMTSSRTLSSLKNLEDPFTYGDQFLLDKENEEEQEKTAQETEAKSIFSVPIHQASPSAPPLSTPVIANDIF